MFRLDWRTPAEWVARVAEHPLELLSDHAHCELKAASTAQSLIVRNPERRELAEHLAAVAIEEMRHFRTVLLELHGRGGGLSEPQPSPYADALHRAAKQTRGDALLDRLVVAGLIEARSLERFHLLAAHLPDPPLARLYRGLMASEAGHQALFERLARRYFPEETVRAREDELRAAEGRIARALPFAPRVHSGLAPAAEPKAPSPTRA